MNKNEDDQVEIENKNRFEIIDTSFSNSENATDESDSGNGERESSHEKFRRLIFSTCLPGEDSIIGPIANLCSATLGAGVLALPFAISSAGIIFGIFLLIIAAASTILSIDMLVESCAKSKQKSYETLTVALFGNAMGWIVEGCILVFCFGVCVAYIVAVGDILEQGVLGSFQNNQLPSFITREFVMVLFWLFIMFPLSLFQKINALRFASLFGVSSICFLVFAVSFHSIRTLSKLPYDPDLYLPSTNSEHSTSTHIKLWPDNFVDAIRACPIILFAFNCQINVPAIFDELKPVSNSHHSSLAMMNKITRGSIRTCFSLYIVMGVLAYLEFGKNTQDNVLKNYCVQLTHDPLMIIAFCGITISVVLAFPLNVFPSRITLDIIVTRFYDRFFESNADVLTDFDDNSIEALLLEDSYLTPCYEENDVLEPSSSPPESLSRRSQIKHFFLTLIISGCALLVAIVVPDISLVFGLLGGFASSLTGLIMPAAFHLKLRLSESRKWKKLGAWALILGGALIGTLSTIVTIESIFQTPDKVDVCSS